MSLTAPFTMQRLSTVFTSIFLMSSLKVQVRDMFESQVTGECGGLFYMLRSLISRGQHGLFLNLKWRHLTYCNYGHHGVWVYEPCLKTLFKFIKAHKAAQLALALASIGDSLMWLSIMNIV